MIRKIKGLMVLLTLAVTLLSINALGQTDKYNAAEKIVVDSAGNVYVTGASMGSGTWYDYATVKYDSSGHELWVARYGNLANSNDWARDVAVDEAGNVYVTGFSSPTLNNVYCTTIKYDSSGKQLWVAKYINQSQGYALAVDALGNVYVAGSSTGDYATIKYDSLGRQLWVATYNGPGNGQDQVSDFVIDASGNAYVTGESVGIGTGFDFATVKYDSSGHELWVARYNTPPNGGDQRPSLTVDSMGNVCVTGSSTNMVSYDYTTIKYDSSGHELWVATHNNPGNSHDWAWDIAADALGNTYVTGFGRVSGVYSDFVTIKYDLLGTPLWTIGYTNPACDMDEWLPSIALDSIGNAYVTGTSYDTTKGTSYDYDLATIKYDSAGHELWVARYTSPESNAWESARDLAVDALGNVYVTGFCDRPWPPFYYTEYLTVKYDSSGQVQWVARYANMEPIIAALIQHVQALDLKNGGGFTALLEAAQASFQEAKARDYVNTINQLEAFRTKCDNEPKLSDADRNALKSEADAIIEYLQSLI